MVITRSMRRRMLESGEPVPEEYFEGLPYKITTRKRRNPVPTPISSPLPSSISSPIHVPSPVPSPLSTRDYNVEDIDEVDVAEPNSNLMSTNDKGGEAPTVKKKMRRGRKIKEPKEASVREETVPETKEDPVEKPDAVKNVKATKTGDGKPKRRYQRRKQANT